MLYDDYVSIIAEQQVSLPFWKPGPKEVSVIASLTTEIFDETEVLLLVLNDDFLMSETQQLWLLVKDSCIIFILFLCYIQQLLILLVICSFTFYLPSRASDTNIYIYSSNPWRSNDRKSPMGHKNIMKFYYFQFSGTQNKRTSELVLRS